MVEPNRLLRTAREAVTSPYVPGAAMNRAELAEAVNAWLHEHTKRPGALTEDYVAKLERGRVRWPGRDYRAAFRAVLRAADDAALGFRPSNRRAVAAPRTETAVDEPTAPADHPRVAAMMWSPSTVCTEVERITASDMATRRQALTAVAGAALTAPLQAWLAPAIPATGRSAFTPPEVVALEQVAVDLTRGRLARKAVVAQLADVTDRLKEAPGGPLTDRVFAVASRLADKVASQAWDSGQHGLAQRYYSLAVRLAHAAQDAPLAAVALAALARQCYDLGRPGDGLEVVQLAQYGTRRCASPRIRSMLATREAWCHAQRGEVAPFRRAVGLAEDHHAESSANDSYLASFDAAELHGVIGARYRDLALHQPRYATIARRHIEQALELRDPARTRNRVFDLVSLARAELIAAEPERAAVLAAEALPLARNYAAGRVGVKLAEFHQEAARYTTVPAVRDVRTAVHDLITA